jgi:tRNA modification GTPase
MTRFLQRSTLGASSNTATSRSSIKPMHIASHGPWLNGGSTSSSCNAGRSASQLCFANPITKICVSLQIHHPSASVQQRRHHSSALLPLPIPSFNYQLHTHPQSYPYSTVKHSAASPTEESPTSLSSNDNDNSNNNEEEETVFALSSGGGGASIGSGATAVAVIRISGPCAFDALRELMSPYPLSGGVGGEGVGKVKLPKLPNARMASLRTLYDPTADAKGTSDDEEEMQQQKRDPLDSALVLTFEGPNSFTGEDIVELHCHGSRAVVHGVLSALSSLSSRAIPSTSTSQQKRRLQLRPADPGEFTQRAYAHGKLGLVEVEALADLIVADTSLQRKQALQQFDGRLSRLYGGWREELIKGLAHAEAVIDFGDDEALDAHDEFDDGLNANDGGMSIWGTIAPRIRSLRQAMNRHLADASRGELLRDGLRIAIVGRPNAGKSSLLNLLAGRDAAIVSSSPGTTRDVVEVMLDLGGVRCTLLDTAGVREEKEEGVNEIEVEGMKRARRAARDAHIIVGVVDATDLSRGLEAVDELIRVESESDESSSLLNRDNVLYVLNKLDLVEGNENSINSKEQSNSPKFGISCTTSEGVDDFLSSLTQQALSLVSGDRDVNEGSALLSVEGTEGAVITRARHRRHVEAASDALERFEELSGQGYMALDMAAEELRLASSELGRVTGAIDVEDVLDVLFADFCIGK